MSEQGEILIRFEDRGQTYEFTDRDFVRVEEYCENECLGIQFLQAANVLRSLVKSLRDCNEKPPYSLEDLSSPAVEADLTQSGEMGRVEGLFGTSDLPRIARIVAKQTYNFIHKV